MKKFPLVEKLGLLVTRKVEVSFDTTEKSEVFYVTATELESILQNAYKLYFSKTNNVNSYYRNEQGHSSTHCGLLIMESELKKCEKHQPPDSWTKGSQTFCIHCGTELVVSFSPKD